MKTETQWRSIGLCPHHGFLVPLSAIRTQNSCGIGEFFDLIPLINWSASIGFDTIQLLPLNDTGFDPSPYNPISSCALDPVYLSLSPLAEGAPLPSLEGKPWQEVKAAKLEWLKSYFKKHPQDTTDFLNKNPWLESYAHFKKDFAFECWLQSLCFSQLSQVRQKAGEKKVFLKGDLPILISPCSADVWAHPNLFHRSLVAGAPPDQYNILGQKWGFPLYDWESMERDHFAWWKERLSVISRLYHIYRIDHVVGFFRIWGIPPDLPATEGHFIPQNPSLWMGQGRKLLEMLISQSPLLPMAEDLGTIPPGVYPVLKNLGICGTKVIRWQRKTNGSYIPYAEYEPLSLTTLSTPDTDCLQNWWRNSPEESEAFAEFKKWKYQPNLTPEQRVVLLHDAHTTPSYFHINLLQEYLALFPDLAWESSDQDRINTPGTVSPLNWSFRFRTPLETIVSHRPLASLLRSLIE